MQTIAECRTFMENEEYRTLFPIRGLAERTGVGPSTLRAWERRYGLLQPQRTPKGHRLYTEDDAQLVRRVIRLLDQGQAISEVARRVLTEAEDSDPTTGASVSDGTGRDASETVSAQWDEYLDKLLHAVQTFSPQRLEAVYNEASSLYPLDLVSKQLIEPALTSLGLRWRDESIGIAEEHFFSSWLRNKLGARIHHSSVQTSGSTLVVACVPGHRHEIGALLFSLAAYSRGYQVIYLGIDMPLEPLAEVVRRCDARAVILAGGRELDPETTVAALALLATQLSCPLIVGGPISTRYEDALRSADVLPVGEKFDLALQEVATVVPVYPA